METKNVSGEDIMFAILDQKDSTFTININGQLYKHLTSTETIDIMEEAVQQFIGLCGKIINDDITFNQDNLSFTFIIYNDLAQLTINGRKE